MLRFAVYDRGRDRLGWVQATWDTSKPQMLGARAVARHNAQAEATFTVDNDHVRVPDLAAPGARCVVEYQPTGSLEWMRLFSGPVRDRSGEGYPAVRTFTIGDDKALLWNLLGWPNPTGTITQQGDDGTHWRASGPAETVFKQLVAANASRYAIPVTIAPDLGRGTTISVAVRFTPLADVIFPKLDQAGLGVSVVLADDGTSLVVDVYPKRVHTVALSDRAGVIKDRAPSYSDTNPTVTRVVVGAGGEGEARHFAQYVDTTRETDWGEVIEVFRDARDIKPTLLEEPDRDTLMADRATETLTAGAPSASLKLDLVETEHFRFGTAVLLGDVVQASVADGPLLTDTVREVVVTQSAEGGVEVVPRVGERRATPDSPDPALARVVAAALRSIRHLNTEE